LEVDFAIHQSTDNRAARFFKSKRGANIVQLPMEAFPDFWVYAYLVLFKDYRVLIDTGSGFGESNQHLKDGLQAASQRLNTEITFANLTHILITHGHIDHFGGLPHIRSKTTAQIGVHEFDLHNLTHTDERLTIVARRLNIFLSEAGIEAKNRSALLQLYQLTKLEYLPGRVDFTYQAAGMQVGPFEILHVPGHCAGHVLIRLHDIIFAGDHVLSKISPHQAPEQLALQTGLSHYLQSLQTSRTWAAGNRLVLPGHNSPITDLSNRIDAIQTLHRDRLDEIRAMLAIPQTIVQVSQALFGEVHGYNILLALEETGAHIEYLSLHGQIKISNLDDLKSNNRVNPIYYQTLETNSYQT